VTAGQSAPGRGAQAWRLLLLGGACFAAVLLVWKLPQWQTEAWQAILSPRDLSVRISWTRTWKGRISAAPFSAVRISAAPTSRAPI
jgi:hypothetical protein